MSINKYLNEQDKNILKKDFLDFLNNKEKKLSLETIERYQSDIDFFLRNYILGKVMSNDYPSYFTQSILEDFLLERTGATAKATITTLLDLLVSKEKLELKLALIIKKVLSNYTKKPVDDLNFLNKKDIEFIFGNLVDYNSKDDEAKLIAPVVWSLSYFCGFEQTHIKQLKLSDLNLKNKSIRNLRSDKDDSLVKWISVKDELTLDRIRVYLEYRKSLNIKTDSMILINGTPPKHLNKFFLMLKDRSRNMDNLSTTVNAQKLIRTNILFSLMESSGQDAFKFIRIHGLEKNSQLYNALTEHMKILNSQELYFQE